MYQDVKRKTSGCLPCKRRKSVRPLRAGATEGWLAGVPFERIHIDVVGGFAETPEGYDRIMTIMCAMSGWAMAVAICDEDQGTFLKVVFERVVCVHGCPRFIVTDRAKGFIGKLAKDLCKRLGIKKIETSGYMPQANGKVERFHRYLGAALTIYANDKTEWLKHLPAVVFAYNVSTHAVTGYSPFQIVYGRDCRLPLDLLYEADDTVYADERQYGLAVSRALRDTFKVVRKRQQEAQMKMAQRRNKGRYDVEFEVGSWVLHWDPESIKRKPKTKQNRVPQKMLYRFGMPCRVMSKVDETHYYILNHWRKRGPKQYKVHVSKMVPFMPWEEGNMDWKEAVTESVVKQAELEAESNKTDADKIRGPRPGDMVVVNIESALEPFGVGKVIAENRGKFKIHWYGNSSYNVLGTLRPGWIDSRDGKIYHQTTPKGNTNPKKARFTNESPSGKCEVTRAIIKVWDFELTTSRKLPSHVLDDIDDDDDIRWTRPTRNKQSTDEGKQIRRDE